MDGGRLNPTGETLKETMVDFIQMQKNIGTVHNASPFLGHKLIESCQIWMNMNKITDTRFSIQMEQAVLDFARIFSVKQMRNILFRLEILASRDRCASQSLLHTFSTQIILPPQYS